MDERILDALAAGVPVITRGVRLARVIRRAYDDQQRERGAEAWASAAVMPWPAWISSLWNESRQMADSPAMLSACQEWALWNRVISDSPEAADLLQPGATAVAAQRSWAVAVEWRLLLERVEVEGGEDSKAFARWARGFRTLCQSEVVVDAASVPDLVVKSVDRLRLPERVLLTGFDEFSPQQDEVLEAVERAGCQSTVIRPPRQVPSGRVVRVPYADAEQALVAAARWARRLLEESPGESVGVIVPDLSARRSAVERIFRGILAPAALLTGDRPVPVMNLSAGQTLASYPTVRSALALLRLRPDGNKWEAISGLLLDPYITRAETERATRACLDVRLRKSGLSRVSLTDVCGRAASSPGLRRAISRLLRVWRATPERQTAAAWARSFAAALKAAGWPGERPLDSVEYQTVEAWKAALSEFSTVDFAAGEMRLSDAVALLARIADSTVFQPEGHNAPVQIMGTLEASGLSFDHLWVAGLDNETWPPAPSPDPFLPIRLQREAGVPRCSAERELGFTALVTDRLLASSGDIVVSYPTRDGDRELGPSPLILSLPKVAAEEIALSGVTTYDDMIRGSRAVESMVDEQGPPVPPEVVQAGGVKVFQYQAACPFHAFAELRLGAEPLGSPGPGLDAGERGTLAHSTLEKFWTEVRSQEALLTRMDIPEVIRRSAEWAVERLEARRGTPLPQRFAELERRRLERLTSEWLNIEKSREPFEVLEPEKDREAEVGGIRFRLRMDRVDRLRAGGDVIVDYKTAGRTTSAWQGERPEEPQVPLYSVVYGDGALAGVAFGILKPGEAGFRGFAESASAIPKTEQAELAPIVQQWRAVLERLAGEFREGLAATDPKDLNKSCRYCTLAGLCRIGDGGTVFDEEAA
jgi:probable DNA repair protein